MVRGKGRILLLACCISIVRVVAYTSLAHAQPPFEWPEKPKNIKVLPEDAKKEKLAGTMIGFTRALGVRCPYCHVGQEGKPLSTFDFASDENPNKQIARDMYRMLGHINEDLKAMKLAGSIRVKMSCNTCHHGLPRPTTLVDRLAATYDSSGVDSTIATYKELRARYYGRSAFDFGDGTLAELGESLAEKGREQDALSLHKFNVEMFPSSLRAYEGLAEAYVDTGQKDKAIQAFRKMLELDPQNRYAQRRLEELQASGK